MVDKATFGIGIEEVVEEEREINVSVGDELGMNLNNIFKVLGFDGGVEEMVEMGWSGS